MTIARNPITGALLKTKPATNQYRDNYDAIFGKKAEKEEPKKDEKK